MKKLIKKLIKSNNVELRADIKAVKKQYKKDLKALDNKYSKQIENIKADNKKTIDEQGMQEKTIIGQDMQEETIELKYPVEAVENDLVIQNDTKNLNVIEVRRKTNKKTKTGK